MTDSQINSRQAGAEIEITPKKRGVSLSMVEAGADFVRQWGGGGDAVKRGLCTSEAELADGVYRAMERLRLRDS